MMVGVANMVFDVSIWWTFFIFGRANVTFDGGCGKLMTYAG